MSEFHESEDLLPEEAKEYHRMIQSVIEELEAVNWYNQRAAVTTDPQLKAIVEHNRDEEIEHACMGLEWLRRNSETWAEELETYLFTEGDITALEEGEENSSAASDNNSLGIGG
ncbi:MAG: encapsulin-associated ferritin-like protein [bacterium]